jgi:hypothetical protein
MSAGARRIGVCVSKVGGESTGWLPKRGFAVEHTEVEETAATHDTHGTQDRTDRTDDDEKKNGSRDVVSGPERSRRGIP